MQLQHTYQKFVQLQENKFTPVFPFRTRRWCLQPQMSNPPTTNFSRYDEFAGKLKQIAAQFEHTVRRYNDAVVVYYPYERIGKRSVGVNRLITNYYRPSAVEEREINAAADPGKVRSFAAFKHAIDAATFRAKFACLSEKKYEGFSEASVAANHLKSLSVLPLYDAEFKLGSRNITVREQPLESAEWVHLTGSIDHLYYNSASAKLVLVEEKSGYGGAGDKTRFMNMQSLYLKEHHAKQLTFYAYLLLEMAKEAGVVLCADDLELLLVANNKQKHVFAVWRMQYDVRTFLGGVWAAERWCGILDAGHIAVSLELSAPCCRFCGSAANLARTKEAPVWIVCSDCRVRNRCACGKLGRMEGKRSKVKICGKQCPVYSKQRPT